MYDCHRKMAYLLCKLGNRWKYNSRMRRNDCKMSLIEKYSQTITQIMNSFYFIKKCLKIQKALQSLSSEENILSSSYPSSFQPS